jgi:Tfp pilus assembly protein PilF
MGRRHKELSGFFCRHTISRLSVLHCSLGTKAFAGGDYEAAVDEFAASIALDRENVISLWNLARLRWMAGERGLAQELYARAYLISKDPGILKERKRTVPVKRPLELSYASQV